MKLYAFDHIDESLKLLPLAARRALDAIGIKLSLEAFRSLPLSDRGILVACGTGDVVDKEAASACIKEASPAGAPMASPDEPSAVDVPGTVLSVLGNDRPLPEKIWQELTSLDRYVLDKITKKNRPDRVSDAYNEIIGSSAVSTHLRKKGGVHMVSIAKKDVTERVATAECWLRMSPDAFHRLTSKTAPKGDVLGTARLAGIMATKQTSNLIPLCHPLALQYVDIDFEEHKEEAKIRVLCTTQVEARTGVEMEAMVGANIAALTIYDMLKSIDRSMILGPARLLIKSGGRSGTYEAPPDGVKAGIPSKGADS